MPANPVRKAETSRAETSRAEKTDGAQLMPLSRRLFAGAVAVLIAVLIAFSCWVSVAAITQKIRVVRGASQIIDIVDTARHIAELERNFGVAGREDILLRIASMEDPDIPAKSDVQRTKTNPWGGLLTAYTTSGSRFRVDDSVPSPVCARLIGLLTGNITSLGLQQIEARGQNQSWRQIYTAGNNGVLSKNEIKAGCRGEDRVVLALTFSLR